MVNNTAPFVFGGTTNIAITSSGSGGGGGDDFDRLETASNMIVNALRQDEDSKESDPYRRLLMNPSSGSSSSSSTPTPFSPSSSSSTTSTTSTTTGGSHLYRPTRGSTEEWMTTLGNDLMMASSASASASASTGSRDTTAAANTSDRRGTTSNRTSTSPSQQQRQQQHQQQRSPLFHLGGGNRGAGGRTSSSSSSSRPNLYYGGSGQRGGDGGLSDGNQFHDARSSPVDHGSSAEQHHQQQRQQQQQQQLKLLETSLLPTSTILYESSVPMPEYLSKLITTEAKVVSLMGLLPECSLAWISVDYKLYLWHYDSSSSSITGKAPITTSSNVIVDFCETHVPSRQCISNVGIAKAKRRVFSQEIEWVIVVVTYEEVLLYALRDMTRGGGGGFSTKGGNGFGPNGSLQLLPTDFVVPTEDVSMVSITSTSTGRLFLGGTDGHLYEMMYEQQCSVSNFGGVGTRWVSSSTTTNNIDTDYEDYGEGMEEENEGWTSYGKRLLKDTFLGSSRGGMPEGGGGPSSVKRRRVCSKLKHTDGSSGASGSLFSSVVPTFLQKLALTSSSATGSRSLIDMTIDEERGVLHTLSENGTLCIYELGDDYDGSGNLAGSGSSNGGFFFGTTTSTTSTQSKNTSLSLPLLTSIQLKDVSKKYLEALKRHAVYTNSSDYIFGGGPTAALRGLGGGGGATGRSLNAVECASTLLKLSELASSSTNAASTTRGGGGTTTSSNRGGTATSNAVDVLKPTRIFVVPCQASRQLFAIVVTQGGLRYYLNLPSSSDENWKQRTLCHIRSPPSSIAAILMSSSSQQQQQSLTITNKYRFDEEGMVPGIMQPLKKPSSTTSATSTRTSTSPSSTPSPYRRSTGTTGTTGTAPMAVPVVASHLLAHDDVFLMGLDGDSLLNANATNNVNPSSSDGIVGILPDITHRRTEEHVIGADSSMLPDGARSGGNAATNTTTRVGIMSPPGTNTTGGSTGTTTTTAGGTIVPRHTIAPGINEVVTCPLPNNTFMGRTTNHDLASLALLPGGKICSIAGSSSGSIRNSVMNHPWSTTGSTSDTFMMEWLVQRSVTPSTKDDQWKGSLALGHLPPCPKVVRQSPIQQYNTVTGDILHYKKYKLRMDGTGGSSKNNHKGYVVPSPTTSQNKKSKASPSSSPLVLHECYQFSKAVPLSPFVQQLYHFIYRKANDLSTSITESNNGMFILNAAGVHRLRVRSVMELYKELVFKLPSSIFFGSSSSSSSRSISTSTSASRGGLCRTLVQQFIRAYGQDEVCVMSLILAIGISSTEELVKRGRQLAMSYGGRPSYNSQMAAAATAAAAAARNANESSSSSPPNGSRTSTTGQTNRASGGGGGTSNGTSNAMMVRYGGSGGSNSIANPYHYYVPAAFESSSLLKGVTKLMARLLRPIWLKPLVVVTSPVGTGSSTSSSRLKQRNVSSSSSRRSTSTLRTRQSSSGKSSLSQSQRPPRPYAVEFLLYNNAAFMQMYRPLKKLELLLRDMFKHAIEQVPGSHSYQGKEDEMMDIDTPTTTFGSSHHLGYMSSALRQYYQNPQPQQGWQQQQQQPYGRTGTTTGVAAAAAPPMNDVALADLLEKESLHNLYRLLSRTTQLLDLFQLLFRTSVDSTTTEVEWGLLHQLTVYQLVCAPESSDRITALLQNLLLTNTTPTTGDSGRPYPYTNELDDSTTHLKYQLAQTISTKCYLWFDQGDLLAQKAYNVTMEAKHNLPGSIDFGSCAAEAAKLWTQAAACWKSAKVVMGQVSLSTLVSPSTSTTTTSTSATPTPGTTKASSTSNATYDDNNDSVVMEMISFPTPLGGSEFGSSPLVKACLSLYELGKVNATVDVCLTCASNFGGSAIGTAGESYVTPSAGAIAGPSTSSRPFGGGSMTGSSRLDGRTANATTTNNTSNVTYEWEMGLYKSGRSSSRSTTTSINEPVWSSSGIMRNPNQHQTMLALVPQPQARALSAPQKMRNKDVCRFCYSLVLYFLNLLLSNQGDTNVENSTENGANQNGYYYNNMGSLVNRRGTTTANIRTTMTSQSSSPADQMLSVCSNSKDYEFHKMLYMFLLCDNRYTNYLLRLQTPFLEHWLKAESWLFAAAVVPPARGSSTNDAAALAVRLPSGMELLYEHYTLQDKFGCACFVMEEMARSPNPTTGTRRFTKRVLTLSDRIDCITRAMSAAQSSLRQQTSNGGIPSGDVSLPQTKLSELEDLLDIARIQYRLLQLVNDNMILNENVIESNRMDDGADDNDIAVVVDQEEALVKRAKEVGMITQQEYFVLGHELVSATDLLYQYASRLEFYDVCLIIMNSCRESNEDMIHTLWHNIFGQELEHVWSSSREDLPSLLADICNDGDSSMFEQQAEDGASGQTRTRNEEDRFENGSWVKRLSKRITSLGRELFGKDADFTFPVPYLILTLEQLRVLFVTLTNNGRECEDATGCGPWTIECIAQANVPYDALLQSYDTVLQEWILNSSQDPNMDNRMHYFQCVGEVLCLWIAAADQSNTRYDDDQDYSRDATSGISQHRSPGALLRASVRSAGLDDKIDQYINQLESTVVGGNTQQEAKKLLTLFKQIKQTIDRYWN